MKLILFLGAGVSAPSGLPTATELMERIMRGTYHQEESHVYREGPGTDPVLRAIDLTPRIRRLLKILTAHDIRDIKRVGYYPVRRGFRSSGAIYRGSSTYEDVFFLCQQISLWNIGLSDNSLATPFMECIERKARGWLSGRTIKARISDLATLGSQACDLIETVVADALRQKYRAGFDLLLELATAPEIEQLNIVTLNHDTLTEQYLSAHGVDFVDGFGPADGDVRWSDDRLYDSAAARVQLFKLHGSVDWYRFSGSARTAMVPGGIALTVNDGAGQRLNPLFRRPSFLSGVNKVTWYQRGIYADIHFRFHQLLRGLRPHRHVRLRMGRHGDQFPAGQVDGRLRPEQNHSSSRSTRETCEQVHAPRKRLRRVDSVGATYLYQALAQRYEPEGAAAVSSLRLIDPRPPASLELWILCADVGRSGRGSKVRDRHLIVSQRIDSSSALVSSNVTSPGQRGPRLEVDA